MPISYGNAQSWGQEQHTYAQPSLQLEHEFDFTPVPSTSNDVQHQSHQASNFPNSYQPLENQHQLGGLSSSSMSHPTFSNAPSHLASFTTTTSLPDDSSGFVPIAYGSNQSGNQNAGSFDTLYNNNPSPEQQLGWTNGASFSYQNQISSTYPGSSYTMSEGSLGIVNHLSSSPTPMQDNFPRRPPPETHQPLAFHPTKPPSGAFDPRAKRPRSQHDDGKDDEQDIDMVGDGKEAAKIKPGACARCKNLKVKCEFKTDTDPCKRCLNGGHECMIPGRKKRRTPPKREHLLNQIREQASQIKELMAQLEATNNASPFQRQTSVTSDLYTYSPRVPSPVLSPSSTATSFLEPDTTASSDNTNSLSNKVVEDWIAKAKQSFQEFDGFIGIGGAGMPKSYFVEEDLEDSGSSDDDFVTVEGSEYENDESYEFAIENHDGEDITTPERSLRHRSSKSSVGTSGTGATGGTRKMGTAEGSKPAILPVGAAPFGLFSVLSLKTPRKRGSSAEIEEEDKMPGIANTNFFRSLPPKSSDHPKLQIQTPHILSRGIITPKEAEHLFQIYFERMNLSVSLLDPVLYTAQRTCYRSPFLFTVICAIASRFYRERQDLYPHIMHYAQLAAGTALISGTKNVEMCSAYILLSLYPVPAKKWEDQRSWLYLGLAIRTATDLNLHLPNTAKPLNEHHAREMLNRTRVWLNCFNLDRSTGSQYGKAPIISNGDYMANHSEDWWKSSPHNMKNFDIQICAYNSELKVMAAFIGKIYNDPHHPTGLNKEIDFEKIATETDEELKQLWQKWSTLLDQTDMTDPQNSFRTGLLRLAFPYARLVALSYGFQHVFGKGNTDENPFLLRCLHAATDVAHAVLDDICRPSQLTYWRHGPEAQSVFVTFASAFLVKLLQPKFALYITPEKRTEIRELVQRVIDLLSSPEIAIDDRHGPKLYSKFLKGLLAAPMARADSTTTRKVRKPKTGQTPEPSSEAGHTTFQPSPAHSSSLSPPPREMALSFDRFAPVGAVTDPFAHSMNIGLDDAAGINVTSDYFQPPLPFDEEILNSWQSLSPSGWQDTTLSSGPVWSNQFNQFQQNLGLDIRSHYISMFGDESQQVVGMSQ